MFRPLYQAFRKEKPVRIKSKRSARKAQTADVTIVLNDLSQTTPSRIDCDFKNVEREPVDSGQDTSKSTDDCENCNRSTMINLMRTSHSRARRVTSLGAGAKASVTPLASEGRSDFGDFNRGAYGEDRDVESGVHGEGREKGSGTRKCCVLVVGVLLTLLLVIVIVAIVTSRSEHFLESSNVSFRLLLIVSDGGGRRGASYRDNEHTPSTYDGVATSEGK